MNYKQLGGGNWITQSQPTNFHQFYKTKMVLTEAEISQWKEVTEAEKVRIESADKSALESGLGVRTELTPIAEAYGVIFNDVTGYYESCGKVDITEAQVRQMLPFFGMCRNISEGRSFKSLAPTSIVGPIIGSARGGNLDGSLLFAYSFVSCVLFNPTYNNNSAGFTDASEMFNFATELTEVWGFQFRKNRENIPTRAMFPNNSRLVIAQLKYLHSDIAFPNSGDLSMESVEYMVDNSNVADFPNIESITITLHPKVYAKLTDELVAKATEKQINFATT